MRFRHKSITVVIPTPSFAVQKRVCIKVRKLTLARNQQHNQIDRQIPHKQLILRYLRMINLSLESRMTMNLNSNFPQLTKEKITIWVTIRQFLSLLNLTFSLSLGVFYLLGYQSTDWQVSVSEWLAVWMAEFYVLTFYWDLGNEFFIEQVKEFFGWRVKDMGRYQLVNEEDFALDMD